MMGMEGKLYDTHMLSRREVEKSIRLQGQTPDNSIHRAVLEDVV